MSDTDQSLDWQLEEAVLRWYGFAIAADPPTVPVAKTILELAVDRRHFEESMLEETDPGVFVFNLQELPSIVVQAQLLEQIHPQVGGWKLQVDSTLIGDADGTDEKFLLWKRQMEDCLNWDALAAGLTAQVGKLKVYGIQQRAPGRKQTVARHFESTYSLILFAANLAP